MTYHVHSGELLCDLPGGDVQQVGVRRGGVHRQGLGLAAVAGGGGRVRRPGRGAVQQQLTVAGHGGGGVEQVLDERRVADGGFLAKMEPLPLDLRREGGK